MAGRAYSRERMERSLLSASPANDYSGGLFGDVQVPVGPESGRPRYRMNRGGGSIVGRLSMSDEDFWNAISAPGGFADYYFTEGPGKVLLSSTPPAKPPVTPPPPVSMPVVPQVGTTVPKPSRGVPQVVVRKAARMFQQDAGRRFKDGGGTRSGSGTRSSSGPTYTPGTYGGFGGRNINVGVGQAFKNR